MTVDQHELYVASRATDASLSGAARRFFRELAPQDFVVFTYLVILNTFVFRSQPGAARNFWLASVSGLIVLHIVTMLAIRTRWMTNGFFTPFSYRVVTQGCVQITYFWFAQLLPQVSPGAVDQELYHFDLKYFGVEP